MDVARLPLRLENVRNRARYNRDCKSALGGVSHRGTMEIWSQPYKGNNNHPKPGQAFLGLGTCVCKQISVPTFPGWKIGLLGRHRDYSIAGSALSISRPVIRFMICSPVLGPGFQILAIVSARAWGF